MFKSKKFRHDVDNPFDIVGTSWNLFDSRKVKTYLEKENELGEAILTDTDINIISKHINEITSMNQSTTSNAEITLSFKAMLLNYWSKIKL
jgi:hypothetical protein